MKEAESWMVTEWRFARNLLTAQLKKVSNGLRECAPDDRLGDEAIHSFKTWSDGLLRFRLRSSSYSGQVARNDAFAN
jgi:hypothetical protein